MSDTPQGPGWWLASDGRYYPPQDAEPSPPAVAAPPLGAPDAARATSGPPITSTPPAPGQHWVPPSATSAAAPAARATGMGQSRRLWIVLGVVVAFGLTAAALVGLVVLSGDSSDETEPAPRPSAAPTTATVPREPSGGLDPTPDAAAPTPSSDVVVAESGFTVGEGFDGGPAANAGVVLRNVGSQPRAFVEVVITFLGADGSPVGTETSYVYAIDAGGTAHAAVDGVPLLGPPTEMRAVVVAEQEPSFWTGTVLPVQVGPVVVDDFFGLEVSGTASNPTATDVMGVAVQCVVRLGGTIVGGTLAMVVMIDAGAQADWEAITFSDWLRGDTAECSGSVLD